MTRTLATQSNQESIDGNSVWLRGNLTTVASPTVINQALLHWARDQRRFDPNSNSPEVFINGFGVLGGNTFGPQHSRTDDVQFSDDISFARSGTTIRLGANFAYDPASELSEPFVNGRFDFNSLSDLVAGNLRRYRQTFLARRREV